MNRNRVLLLAITASTLLLLGAAQLFANGTAEKKQSKTLTVWWYEPADNAMAQAWNVALNEFKQKYPQTTVKFEQKSFEDLQKTFRMVLASGKGPDISEFNKGTATMGQLVKDGLLYNLDSVFDQHGWNKKLSPSLQNVLRYDSHGRMGQGSVYGITTYGEFIMVYYNKEMFRKYGVTVPKNLAQFEQVCNTFVKKGIAPIAFGDADKWPAFHEFGELLNYSASRSFINNYIFLKKKINFSGPEFMSALTKFQNWVKAGYFPKDFMAVSYDDMWKGFVAQKSPMLITGSWLYGTLLKEAKNFDWGVFLMPGKKLNVGSGGNAFVIPKNATNKQGAIDLMDLMLGTQSQTTMALKGGVPATTIDYAKITDPKVLRINTLFDTINKNDGFSYYVDWPVPTFFDVFGNALQGLLSMRSTPADVAAVLQKAYDSYFDKTVGSAR